MDQFEYVMVGVPLFQPFIRMDDGPLFILGRLCGHPLSYGRGTRAEILGRRYESAELLSAAKGLVLRPDHSDDCCGSGRQLSERWGRVHPGNWRFEYCIFDFDLCERIRGDQI